MRFSIKEALAVISEQELSALVCDLHLPAAGDGFTLVNALRHLQPNAISIIISSYPALRESLSQLLPQADEILLTPIPNQEVVTLLKKRLANPKHHNPRLVEPVATILKRHAAATVREWLRRVNLNENLSHVGLTDVARTGHLKVLLAGLVERLREPHSHEGAAKPSPAAVAHGKTRQRQGYSAAMLVEESRILQVCIFNTLRKNLNAVDLALVLTDVMTIADEVDSQLTQTMNSFSEHVEETRRLGRRSVERAAKRISAPKKRGPVSKRGAARPSTPTVKPKSATLNSARMAAAQGRR